MKKRKFTRRLWTEKECEVMISMFANNYTIDICKILNRTYGSICSQANIMNLKKSDEFRSMELQRLLVLNLDIQKVVSLRTKASQ